MGNSKVFKLVKWLVAASAGLSLMVQSVLTVQAAGQASASSISTTSSIEAPKDTVIGNQSVTNGVPIISSQADNPPNIVSQSAVVMDMTTGTIVYAKNPQATHYPASLTKMLTALVALDKGHLNDELTVSKLATEQPPDKLYLVPGEQEPLGKILYGMLLNSANDAAVVVAQNYGGSISGFAKLMNEKAASLGATHTHFENPSGLPNPKHVTTAYDLALIARAAMNNPVFRKIVATKHYDWKGKAWRSNLLNINPMLFTYPGAIGVKTGYTSVAHETLAVAAKHGNQTFLAILMDAPLQSQIDNDATTILNYAFSHYQTKTLVTKGSVVGHLTLQNGTRVPMHASRPVMATVLKGHPFNVGHKISLKNIQNSKGGATTVGQLKLIEGKTVIASDPLIATLPKVPLLVENKALRGAVAAFAVFLALILVFLSLLSIRRRKRRRVSFKFPIEESYAKETNPPGSASFPTDTRPDSYLSEDNCAERLREK